MINTWADDSTHTIESPFNVEKLLHSCEEFYKEWQKNPFWIVMENGRITIKYFDEIMDV